MNFTIPSFVTFIIAIGGTAGFIWFLFEKAEDTISHQSKESISKWLRNIEPLNHASHWTNQFPKLFDRLFGRRHLTVYCFARSCLFSFISLLVITLIWATFRTDEFIHVFSGQGRSAAIIDLVRSFFAFNIFIDYLSLLQTRVILEICRERNTNRFLLLVADLLLSLSIAVLGFSLICVALIFSGFAGVVIPPADLLAIPFSLWYESFMPVLTSVVELSTGNMDSFISPGVYFYSTFLTSVWLWLYIASGTLIRVLKIFDQKVSVLKGILDIDEKPLRSMGLVSVFIVIILFLVSALFM